MIESLIEILEQTPVDTLCDSGVGCHAVDCNKCPFLDENSKEHLITELEELIDANR